MAITAGQPIIASDFINTSAGSGDSGKGAKLDARGKLSGSLMGGFGDGSDGDVTISSPTTLVRDMYYRNLIVTSTLTTDGYRIYVSEQISGAGTIDWGTPNAGGNGTSTAVVGSGAGLGGAQSGSGLFKNRAGTRGGNNNNTSAGIGLGDTGVAASSYTGLGFVGGVGGTGGNTGGAPAAGGTVGVLTAPADSWKHIRTLAVLVMNQRISDGALASMAVPHTEATGGGSGQDAVSGGYTGGAGGGGASGGIVWICARIWAGTFTIKSVGANGGAGVAVVTGGGNIGGNGGGAAGNGGLSIVIYGVKTWSGAYNLVAGTVGAGSAGNGTGTAGANGGAGVTGTSYEFDIADLT